MGNKILTGALIGCLLTIIPVLASAKDKNSGERMKIKNAKVMQVDMDKGLIVVKKNNAIYNFALGLSNPNKTELLSKYGVMVDFAKLEPGDRITCRGRRFPNYFVPAKCRLENGSQKKLYKKKKGIIVADVYGIDSVNNLIYAATSLDKTYLTTIKKGKSKITYKGENRSISKLKAYWRLVVKGEWDKDTQMFRKVKYIKIKNKSKQEPLYRY